MKHFFRNLSFVEALRQPFTRFVSAIYQKTPLSPISLSSLSKWSILGLSKQFQMHVLVLRCEADRAIFISMHLPFNIN